MRLVLASVLLLTTACEVVDSAQATTVIGGLAVATPAVSIQGQLDVPSEVAASAWVSERDNAVSSNLTPIDGAIAAVIIDDQSLDLPFASDGRYTLTSLDNSELVYRAGSAYTFTAEVNGARRGGTVPAAPEQLTPAAITLSPQPTAAHPAVPEALLHPANTALTLSFPAQYGKYGYVVVLRADPSAPDNPTVVYDSRPQTAAEVLELIVGDGNRTLEVPAATFAQDGIYGVILFAVERGTDLLPNTFIGSAFLVGSGVAIVVGVDG